MCGRGLPRKTVGKGGERDGGAPAGASAHREAQFPRFTERAPVRASELDAAGDTGVMERASADAERSIPPNRRLSPNHRLEAHRVNGENALALPPARSRPTSPRHPQRPRRGARSRPAEHPGFMICPLHTCASSRLRVILRGRGRRPWRCGETALGAPYKGGRLWRRDLARSCRGR